MRSIRICMLIASLLFPVICIPGCNKIPDKTSSVSEITAGSEASKITEGPAAVDTIESSAGADTEESAIAAETKDEATNEITEENKEERIMRLKIDETEVVVSWEDNEAVEALKKMTEKSPLTIKTSAYGGFEQVGSIGKSLPKNDHQTKTSAGDIVLYSGNQIVVFYGSNSWAYTRLGHIDNKTTKELEEMLDKDSVNLTLY